MAVTVLDLQALTLLDMGKVNALFLRAMENVARDLSGRPTDESARKVEVVFSFRPVASDGMLEETRMEVVVKTKVPAQRTREYSMGITPKGQAVFNVDAPDNCNQETLDMEDDD